MRRAEVSNDITHQQRDTEGGGSLLRNAVNAFDLEWVVFKVAARCLDFLKMSWRPQTIRSETPEKVLGWG